MKYILRFLVALLFLAGSISLVKLSTENSKLSAEVDRLEVELGKMSIEDIDRVHIVEVESPEVPPEVASKVLGVWQFRCYLPKGYDYFQMSGSGQVTKDGIYQAGGSSSSWGTPNKEAIHELLTVSIQKVNDRLEAYYSFGSSRGTTSWNGVETDRSDSWTVQKLVSSSQGPRSFNQDTILPLLKIYNPGTAKETKLKDKTITTYEGGLFILSPKSRQQVFEQLLRGEMPNDFDPSWLATEASDE
jgi:hypothetical protein